MGAHRRRRGGAAPIEHPRQRLRHRRDRLHRRHAGDPRARWPEPGRLCVPGRGAARRTVEARAAAPGGHGAVSPPRCIAGQPHPRRPPRARRPPTPRDTPGRGPLRAHRIRPAHARPRTAHARAGLAARPATETAQRCDRPHPGYSFTASALRPCPAAAQHAAANHQRGRRRAATGGRDGGAFAHGGAAAELGRPTDETGD